MQTCLNKNRFLSTAVFLSQKEESTEDDDEDEDDDDDDEEEDEEDPSDENNQPEESAESLDATPPAPEAEDSKDKKRGDDSYFPFNSSGLVLIPSTNTVTLTVLLLLNIMNLPLLK